MCHPRQHESPIIMMSLNKLPRIVTLRKTFGEIVTVPRTHVVELFTLGGDMVFARLFDDSVGAVL